MRKEKPLLMVEDKQLICNLLCQTLQATRGGCDLKLLAYENDENRGYESVTVTRIGDMNPLPLIFLIAGAENPST